MFHQEKLTCPFTGEKFIGTFENDNSLSLSNPLTGTSYNFKIYGNGITIPLELFNYVETVTIPQAQKILDVSRQRAYKLAKSGKIPVYRIGNKQVFKLADVLRYKNNKTVGRPNKDEQ